MRLVGETLSGQAFAGPPSRLGLLIWTNQTALTQAKPESPAKALSRPRRVVQRFPKYKTPKRLHEVPEFVNFSDEGKSTVPGAGESAKGLLKSG